MAASMAWVSNWLSVVSPDRSRRSEPGSMRFSTAASGTSLTRTQIFTDASPWSPEARGSPLARRRRRMLPTPLTDESIGVGNQHGAASLAYAAIGSGTGSPVSGTNRGSTSIGASRSISSSRISHSGHDRADDRDDAAEHQDVVDPGEEALARRVGHARPRARGRRPRAPSRGCPTRRPRPARAGGRPVAAGVPAATCSTWTAPRPRKIAPQAAMPIAMPTWRNVSLIPEAMPLCSFGTTRDGHVGDRRVDAGPRRRRRGGSRRAARSSRRSGRSRP